MSIQKRCVADYTNLNVLIMGLGLNGGGLESARYLAQRGAMLTITDLRDEAALAQSLEKLRDIEGIRFVLGRHEMRDFENADMVIKNPGVRRDSPFLRAARRVETDISLFLASSPARLIAVTGSKGKSSVASAIHWGLTEARKRGLMRGKAWLGGNIAVSPLSFLDELCPEDDVVLELSSWQLGDLRGKLFKPRIALLTTILPDHQNYYNSMESYVADKRIIYQGQDSADLTIATDDVWGQSFLRETSARTLVYTENVLPAGVAGAWLLGGKVSDTEKVSDTRKVSDTEKVGGAGFARLAADAEAFEVVPTKLLVPGRHQKKNLLATALALLDLGLPAPFIRETLGAFPGVEHRLEFFHEVAGIRFYNDTTATIPEAVVAALEAFEAPLVLVCGGADKNIDYSPLVQTAFKAKAIILLAGTSTDKLRVLLDQVGLPYQGPFDALDSAIRASFSAAEAGDVVVLSPGAASFGMFKNEFDRGCQWKDAVRRYSLSMFSGDKAQNTGSAG
ncbi:MAG: UDP-N-acetylmuramoyl-L-alanine--D-glutamate ligase [Treponema sp.]|jgi:UDP-N-acetylmuramoylalanine--D-glutamate ligase|nr:UDP-N-acetylmuramoyl-L-alanine--D-glutamate ligase [Treponema sp.]